MYIFIFNILAFIIYFSNIIVAAQNAYLLIYVNTFIFAIKILVFYIMCFYIKIQIITMTIITAYA